MNWSTSASLASESPALVGDTTGISRALKLNAEKPKSSNKRRQLRDRRHGRCAPRLLTPFSGKPNGGKSLFIGFAFRNGAELKQRKGHASREKEKTEILGQCRWSAELRHRY